MDFGIDTIIYIILGLVFLVAQVSRKKKAKSPEIISDNEDVDTNEVAPPSSLLEEFFGSVEERNVVQKTVEKNFYQNDSPPVSSGNHDVDDVFIENLTEKKMEDLPKDEVEESWDQKERPDEVSHFDLRNAVIYSTILERKYF